jgi:hypothetical protein
VLRRGNHDGAVVPQIHFRAGLDLNFMGKLRIHARARHRNGLQSGRCLKRAVHQHAAGRVRGLAPRFASLYKQNCRASLAQRYGKREANDASADDDYVPGLHSGIVKDWSAGRPISSGTERVTGSAGLLKMAT